MFDDVLGTVAARTVAFGIQAHGFELRPASVGRQTVRVQDDQLRSDSTCWLEPNVPATSRPLWDMFNRLGEQLRTRAWLGPLDLEMQLACYPVPSPGYARHRDAFKGRTRRRATAVWYMQEDRASTDGGELRTFGPDGPRDLEPRFDRLVLFDSTTLEHAVRPCRAARWAVTVWFLGPEAPTG